MEISSGLRQETNVRYIWFLLFSITQSSAILEIFDLTGDKIELKAVKYFDEPVFNPLTGNMEDLKNIKSGFMGISATNEYIYTIYSDKNVMEFKPNSIVVFDYDGNVKKIYNTDKVNTNIFYNSFVNYLYAITVTEVEEQ